MSEALEDTRVAGCGFYPRPLKGSKSCGGLPLKGLGVWWREGTSDKLKGTSGVLEKIFLS